MEILDFLFPVFCLECKKQGSYLCQNCLESVLDGNFDRKNFAVFKYKGVVRKAITAIKYKYASDIIDSLVDAVVNRLKVSKLHNVLLVPIPMYKINENFRGFNQSVLMAEKIAKRLNWEFLPDLLLKTVNTKHQVGLKGDERRKNLKHVFCLNPKYINNKELEFSFAMKNKNILLFDDVYTTGTTIREINNVLEINGFKKVYSLTVAR